MSLASASSADSAAQFVGVVSAHEVGSQTGGVEVQTKLGRTLCG